MRGFGRGVQLIENDNGVSLTYVEHSKYVFASPIITENRVFKTWSEAVNFLKLWTILQYVQFADKPILKEE